MKKPIVKCPRCGATNTREWTTGVNIINEISEELWQGFHAFDDDFYGMLRDEFGENKSKQEDYYCAQNICDNCDYRFATKNTVQIQVIQTIVYEKYKAI